VPVRPPLPLPAGFPERAVVLLIGLPGAGKTTYLRRRRLAALSSDELRQTILDDPADQRHPELVFSALRHLLRARLRAGRPLTFVDATNLSPREREPLMAIAEEYRYPCVALYFDVPPEICRRRNRRRGRAVPEAALERLAARLRPPASSEGFAAMYRIDAAGGAAPYFGPQ
jgi:predicted kinase